MDSSTYSLYNDTLSHSRLSNNRDDGDGLNPPKAQVKLNPSSLDCLCQEFWSQLCKSNSLLKCRISQDFYIHSMRRCDMGSNRLGLSHLHSLPGYSLCGISLGLALLTVFSFSS